MYSLFQNLKDMYGIAGRFAQEYFVDKKNVTVDNFIRHILTYDIISVLNNINSQSLIKINLKNTHDNGFYSFRSRTTT